MKKNKRTQESVTIGMDLGDKTNRYCVLNMEGEIVREGQIATTKAGMVETFGSLGPARIAIEVGTHSPWVSRWLRILGYELIVANPRQVKLITESTRKDDRLEAQTLGAFDSDVCALVGAGTSTSRSTRAVVGRDEPQHIDLVDAPWSP